MDDMSDCGLQYSDVIAILVGVLEFCGGMWFIGLTFLGLVWIRRLRRHDGGIDGRPPTRPKKIRNKQKVREGRASFNRRSHRWRDQDAGGMNLGNLGKFYYVYGLSTSFI